MYTNNGLDYDNRSKEGYDEEFSPYLELPDNEAAAKAVAAQMLDAKFDNETDVTRWGDGFWLIQNAQMYWGRANITVWLAGHGNNELNDVEVEDPEEHGW